ncbi:hypothetical protein RIF29_19378 [Crotalaria pallida]|uniref:Helitron helicase-like domain-containing protein n=1 Tax=Crotalaria pallida TaxID=3830 RepID=A0AAN9EZV7_CROPI
MKKLTPGRTILRQRHSSVGRDVPLSNITNVIESSQERMRNLFCNDKVCSIRRLANAMSQHVFNSPGEAMHNENELFPENNQRMRREGFGRVHANQHRQMENNVDAEKSNKQPEFHPTNCSNAQQHAASTSTSYVYEHKLLCSAATTSAPKRRREGGANDGNNCRALVISGNANHNQPGHTGEQQPMVDAISTFDATKCAYDDLGDPEFSCGWCGAKFWLSERVKACSKRNPVYSICCGKGKISVPPLRRPPQYLLPLLTDDDNVKSKHFQEKIRAYNMMFSFTSMGGKLDSAINDGRGRFVYRISGQNHHRIGSLLPGAGQTPRFAQLYIYDTDNEVANRMKSFRGSGEQSGSDFDPEIIQHLQEMFDTYNPICKVFRMARDRLEDDPVQDLKLKLIAHRNKRSGVYNLPVMNEIAALVVGDVNEENDYRDIVVESQAGYLKRIHELHPLYLPLQYPVIHLNGEDGFCDNIPHNNIRQRQNTAEEKRVTVREYFFISISREG